jgi:CheY-like chemotaxis protein
MVAEKGSPGEVTLPDIGQLRGKKALVVDDNKSNLKVLVKLLSTWGVQATPFNSPDLVADMLDALARFDFCLVDMDMPNVDGREIARRIREAYPLERIPVIALASAGNPLVNNKEDYFEAALEKPVRQDALLRVLTRLFTKGPAKGARQQPSISASSSFSGINVLIAEDNPLHQAVAESTLRKMGFRTEHASSAEEMLQKMGKQRFDLVLYDPSLRDLDPGKALKRIRSLSEREEEVPILIGIRSEERIPEEVFQAMDDTLRVPFNLDDFMRKMWDWFPED